MKNQVKSPLELLNARTKDFPELDSTLWSYKLAEGSGPSHSVFGMDVPITEDLAVDEKTYSLWLPVASGVRRDGVGDLLHVEGIRTERHFKRPLVLFDHGKSVELPIARAREIPHEPESYSFRIDPAKRSAGCRAYFYTGKEKCDPKLGCKQYDHALFCEQIFDMLVKDLLGAGSIGYQVVKATHLPPSYETGVPQGLELQQITMLECSSVILPANQDTVTKALSPGTRFCGKLASPYLVKAFTPYAQPKKAMVVSGYETKALPTFGKAQPPTSSGQPPKPQPSAKPVPQTPPAQGDWREAPPRQAAQPVQAAQSVQSAQPAQTSESAFDFDTEVGQAARGVPASSSSTREALFNRYLDDFRAKVAENPTKASMMRQLLKHRAQQIQREFGPEDAVAFLLWARDIINAYKFKRPGRKSLTLLEKALRVPNYRQADDPEYSCQTCEAFQPLGGQFGQCRMFGVQVDPEATCDRWTGEGGESMGEKSLSAPGKHPPGCKCAKCMGMKSKSGAKAKSCGCNACSKGHACPCGQKELPKRVKADEGAPPPPKKPQAQPTQQAQPFQPSQATPPAALPIPQAQPLSQEEMAQEGMVPTQYQVPEEEQIPDEILNPLPYGGTEEGAPEPRRRGRNLRRALGALGTAAGIGAAATLPTATRLAARHPPLRQLAEGIGLMPPSVQTAPREPMPAPPEAAPARRTTPPSQQRRGETPEEAEHRQNRERLLSQQLQERTRPTAPPTQEEAPPPPKRDFEREGAERLSNLESQIRGEQAARAERGRGLETAGGLTEEAEAERAEQARAHGLRPEHMENFTRWKEGLRKRDPEFFREFERLSPYRQGLLWKQTWQGKPASSFEHRRIGDPGKNLPKYRKKSGESTVTHTPQRSQPKPAQSAQPVQPAGQAPLTDVVQNLYGQRRPPATTTQQQSQQQTQQERPLPDLIQELFERGQRRRKSFGATKPEYAWNTKSLKELRLKWRSPKGRYHRSRHGSPGAIHMNLAQSDLEGLRDEASSKGVEVKWISDDGKGSCRVKLTGMDPVLEDLAKKYGKENTRKKIGVSGMKNLPNSSQKDGPWDGGEDGGNVGHNLIGTLPRQLDQKGPRGRERNTTQISELENEHSTFSNPHSSQYQGDDMPPSVQQIQTANKPARDGKKKNLPVGKKAADALLDSRLKPEDGGGEHPMGGDYGPEGYSQGKGRGAIGLGEYDVKQGPEAEEEGEEGMEPYGLQVLRRFHADAAGLLHEYDEMMPLLENERVRQLAVETLQWLSSQLDKLEEAWAGEEGSEGLSPLEGMEEEEEGELEGGQAETAETSGKPATGRLDKEPTPDEALRGMQRQESGKSMTVAQMKALYFQRVKALRNQYGQKCGMGGMDGYGMEIEVQEAGKRRHGGGVGNSPSTGGSGGGVGNKALKSLNLELFSLRKHLMLLGNRMDSGAKSMRVFLLKKLKKTEEMKDTLLNSTEDKKHRPGSDEEKHGGMDLETGKGKKKIQGEKNLAVAN